jgi:hypothetical protein
MSVERLAGTAVVKLPGMRAPVDLQVHEAEPYHGLWIPFSLAPCQEEEGSHQNKTPDFQNLKNMRLHGEILVHS